MAGMRKARAFSFVVLGISSLVAQVLLIRELLVVFTGNEFFIGWTLFAWLFWTAMGALGAGRFRGGTGHPARPLVGCHALVAMLLPPTLAFIRASPALLGAAPGAVPELLPSMGLSLAALAPLCLVLGAQFVLGVRAWKRAVADAEPGNIQGRAYAVETAGFVAGGLLFSTVFVAANEFRVAGLLGCLNALAGLAICAGSRDRSLLLRLVLFAAVAGISPAMFFGAQIGRETRAWRFPGQVLVDSRNSIYGHLAVTAIDRQLNFYENGQLLGAEDEQMASEQLVHYPMLAHPDPRRVLLIGNGFNGALGEILEHAPERVDYVELDPQLIELAKKYAAPVRRAALADPRVKTVFADGRAFLNRLPEGEPTAAYDVVIVNLPGPGTALINRFYTVEFFREVRKRLAPGGLLAVRLAFSPDHVGRELENLGASIYRTLRTEFPTVSILPEYEILYLASDAVSPPTAEDLIARYEARGLQTDFVIPPAIGQRLATDRIGQVRAAFEANRTAQINRDGRPIACAYTFAYWLRSFHPRAAALAGRIGDIRWPWGAGAAAAVVALGMGWAGRGRNRRRTGAWAMGIGGFTLMACELALFLAFQSFCGYLYYRLALILAALMLGMALGTALGTRRVERRGTRTLAGIHALAAAYAAGFALFLWVLESAAVAPTAWMQGAFLLLAAAIGGLIGFEFPVANRMYLAGGPEDSRRSGIIYGVDLIGSCLGALLIGLWALPVLGTEATLWILVGLNAGAALVAATRTNSSVS
jgi:spermidine synthase